MSLKEERKRKKKQYMQWTGDNLNELIQWSDHHIRIKTEDDFQRMILITPDGDQPVVLGDWIVRLKNGTYEVPSYSPIVTRTGWQRFWQGIKNTLTPNKKDSQ